MSIMVVNQGDDPVVLILGSKRGSLELTELQCAAIHAVATAVTPVAGPLNTPKPPQGVRVGVYLSTAPVPARDDRTPYWLIHDCLINPDGFWCGGSHDMTRAILDTIQRNPAAFAREAIDAAHATGFRDGAALVVSRCDAPAGARTGPSSCDVASPSPREQRAWSIYCGESFKATTGKGTSACAGSRWGYATWAALPDALQREYLDKADSAGDRRDPPEVARTGG